jgi:HPt (histidine-containing phosphotransfer) domain-containing protein
MAGKAFTRTAVEKHGVDTRSRPIDLVYLARQTLGDPGLEAEILTLFSEMAASYLEKVTDSPEKDEVLLGLHSLKGAAAGVGAGAIASGAAEAEAELRESGKLSQERLSDLAMAVEEVQAFIADLLAE